MQDISHRAEKRMKSVELFAGAGGLAMGCEIAGFEHLAVVEWDKWACDTVRENQKHGFPLLCNWDLFEGDVREFDWSQIPKDIDLLAGGPPCQPFSIGGKHKANSDTRDMFPATAEAIRQIRPKAFIVENVKGLTRATFASYFQYIQLQLEFPQVAPRNGEDWSEHLKRLQEEVVDIEDMSDGISIMDLGLNEFRLDLLDYIKHNGDLDKKPRGLHAVVPATDELPEGVIFVLKNINNSVNADNRNRIHPFYMVYIGMDGQIICDYLNPKKMLDDIRLLCRGKSEPIKKVYERFNRETDDGKDMAEMSELLSEAIDSIIDVKEESDIDSLFSAGGTTALLSQVSGLDDFELICFLVVK